MLLEFLLKVEEVVKKASTHFGAIVFTYVENFLLETGNSIWHKQ